MSVLFEITVFYRVFVRLSKVSGLQKNGNLGENLPKVSSPNRRNSRFRGDDRWRQVRAPLSGRVGSYIPAVWTSFHSMIDEWHVFERATHCWDCAHLDGVSKTDLRGTHVTYRYDSVATEESRRRVFAFLEKSWRAPSAHQSQDQQ